MKWHNVNSKGDRLDLYLMSLFSDTSRSKIQSLIKSKQILVDGKLSKSSYILKGSEVISYEIFSSISDNNKKESITFEKMELDILYEDKEIIVWNPFTPLGGNTEQAIQNAKIILWQGHCSVHTRFTVDQINNSRDNYPTVNVIAHPECTSDVVSAADYVGSTEFIINTIANAESGTVWAVGTEISLVNRLAKENPDKNIFCLDPVVCPCSTMYRIHPAYLAWVLEGLVEGVVVNEINVEPEIAEYARIALENMLSV